MLFWEVLCHPLWEKLKARKKYFCVRSLSDLLTHLTVMSNPLRADSGIFSFIIQRLHDKLTKKFLFVPPTGVKPYACDICNKTFSVKSYVTAHRWSHVSEKPLSCDRCSMTFTSKSQFAIHIRIHSSGQNFECNLCGRTFIRDSYLIRHHNRVHRDRVQTSSINATINAVVAANTLDEEAEDMFDSNNDLRWKTETEHV